MDNINFQPIFDYIDESGQRIKEELLAVVATKQDVERIITTIDGLAKRTNDNDDRVTVLEHKSEKLEKLGNSSCRKDRNSLRTLIYT